MKKNNRKLRGVGIDVVEIMQFRELLKYRAFQSWKTYFYPQELHYCFSKTKPEMHLAVGFAGKEAVIKAYKQLGVFLQFNQVEISRHPEPKATIHAINSNHFKTIISLSHTAQTAVAFAVVTK